MLVPLSIGNAVRVLFDPPQGAELWRVLRTTGTSFVDENDPAADFIYQGTDLYMVDTFNLANGTQYTYGAFFYDGTGWIPAPVVQCTPDASYQDNSTDVLTVVRDRIDIGLQNEIARGALFPESGVIDVLNAPPSYDQTAWPVVSVHVMSDGSAERSLGEQMEPDMFDVLDGMWDEKHGWMARAQLSIVGWSKNPDERIALRKALRRLVIGNLPVFQGFGMTRIDFTQADHDHMSEFPVPVHATIGSFSCFAPAVVTTEAGVIKGITSTLDPTFPDRSAAVTF